MQRGIWFLLSFGAFLFSAVLGGCAIRQAGDWREFDAQVADAIAAQDWRRARVPARAVPELYMAQAEPFDVGLYVALVQQATEVESALGHAIAAIGLLERAVDVLEARGFGDDPAMAPLFDDLAPLYDLTRRDARAIAARERRIALTKDPGRAFTAYLAYFDWANRNRLLGSSRLASILDRAQSLLPRLSDEAGSEIDWRRLLLAIREQPPATVEARLNARLRHLEAEPDNQLGRWRILALKAALAARAHDEKSLVRMLSQMAALDIAVARRTPVLAPAPRFSRAARARALIVEIRLNLEVDAFGRVQRATIVSSNANRVLERDLVRRVREDWRFVPAWHDGITVPRRIDGVVYRDFAPNHWRAHTPPTPRPGSQLKRPGR